MPHCETGKNGVNHFYRTYGLAGTHWLPQVKGLTGTGRPNDGAVVIGDGHKVGRNDIEVCAIDNRGVGSFIPTKKSSYSTTRMAKDAIAIMDHLGWKEAHVFGHSTEFLSDSVVGCQNFHRRWLSVYSKDNLSLHETRNDECSCRSISYLRVE